MQVLARAARKNTLRIITSHFNNENPLTNQQVQRYQMASDKIVVKVCRINKKNPVPGYMSKGASGIDLLASLDQDITLPPGEYKCIPTGIVISLPAGYEAQIRPRSGLALKHGLTVLNTPGTVDSDYRGEIMVILINHGKMPLILKNGMRIAQMVIAKVEKARIVEAAARGEIDRTERNDGGFGHTGE